MKKIISILVLFVSSFGFGQNNVIITLQEGNFTSSNSQFSSSFIITDSGLNQILSNYNATYFNETLVSCSTQMAFMAIIPTSQDITNFINELNNYNAVVLDAQQIGINPNCGYCFDVLNIALVDVNNGSFQSLTNGIVQTNNAALNAIFQTYTVFEYANGNQGQVTRCNCNIVDLKTSLQNLNSVIANVDNASCGIAWLLKNENFEKQKLEISPNPFTTIFEITNKETINNYNLYDIIGKEIINTNSKQDLDSKTEVLKTGVYLLQLTFDNGKTDTIKLIKN